jgi:cell division protein FtsN
MTYHFTRKRLVTLVAGLGLLIVLTYAAGVVTGIVLVIPSRQELALLKAGKPALAAGLVSPHLPAAAPAAAPAAPPLPVIAAPQSPVITAAAPPALTAPAPPAITAAVAPAPAPASTAPAPALPNPQQTAAPQPPAAAPLADDDTDTFSLQIGSFRDAKNARQLQTDLKERGYTASVLTALDSDAREWHVVRIDGYKTLASAARAAVDFSRKERLQALVRRSNTL